MADHRLWKMYMWSCVLVFVVVLIFLYSQVLVILRLITTLTLCFILLGPQPVFEILHSKHIGGHEFDLLSRGHLIARRSFVFGGLS